MSAGEINTRQCYCTVLLLSVVAVTQQTDLKGFMTGSTKVGRLHQAQFM